MSDDFQQQDASMEEILGSIRKILSTDDDVKRTYPKKNENQTDPIELTDVADAVEDDEDEDFQMSEPIEKSATSSTFEDHGKEAPQPWEKVTEETVAQADNFKPNTRLVSQATMAASNAALSELTKHVKGEDTAKESSVNTSVEELLKSMLSPLLKDWLDKNLPTVIEKVVREEIRTIVNNTSK